MQLNLTDWDKFCVCFAPICVQNLLVLSGVNQSFRIRIWVFIRRFGEVVQLFQIHVSRTNANFYLAILKLKSRLYELRLQQLRYFLFRDYYSRLFNLRTGT